MDYEKTLKEALNSKATPFEVSSWIEEQFPKLKESEDDRIRKWIIRDIKQSLEDNVYNDESIDSAKEALAWLKKQGSQNLANTAKTCKDEQKPAWSEEDEHNLFELVMELEYRSGLYQLNHKDYSQMIKWLKDLKDRYAWKPSDEQMHYLSWIANVKLGDGVVEQEVSKHLNELYQDLKKLKGYSYESKRAR